MDPRDEDELWKEIVENYGETPVVDDPMEDSATPTIPVESAPSLPEPEPLPPDPAPDPEPEPSTPGRDPSAPDPDPLRTSWEDEGHFEPPPPPPIPAPEPKRMLAWIGLFGAPTLMLIALVAGRPFRGFSAVFLALAFVGGFVYLVRTMPNGPRDPGDDGARI